MYRRRVCVVYRVLLACTRVLFRVATTHNPTTAALCCCSDGDLHFQQPSLVCAIVVSSVSCRVAGLFSIQSAALHRSRV